MLYIPGRMLIWFSTYNKDYKRVNRRFFYSPVSKWWWFFDENNEVYSFQTEVTPNHRGELIKAIGELRKRIKSEGNCEHITKRYLSNYMLVSNTGTSMEWRTVDVMPKKGELVWRQPTHDIIHQYCWRREGCTELTAGIHVSTILSSHYLYRSVQRVPHLWAHFITVHEPDNAMYMNRLICTRKKGHRTVFECKMIRWQFFRNPELGSPCWDYPRVVCRWTDDLEPFMPKKGEWIDYRDWVKVQHSFYKYGLRMSPN